MTTPIIVACGLILLLLLCFWCFWYIKYQVYHEVVIQHGDGEPDEVFVGRLICEVDGPYIFEEYRLYLTKDSFFILLKKRTRSNTIEWWKKFLNPEDVLPQIKLNKQFKKLFIKAAKKLPEFKNLVNVPISHPAVDAMEQEQAKKDKTSSSAG